MVASLLRLRLLGLVNRVIRPRSRAEQFAALIAGFLGLAAIVAIIGLGEFAAGTTPELRSAVFVTAGSIAVAGFWLVPFVVRTTGGVDPRAFTSFPIPPRRLALGLAISSVVSFPMLLLALLVIVAVIAWAPAGPAVVLAAAGSGILAIAIALLGSLIAASIASDGIAARNLAGLIALTVIAVLAPLLAFVDWAVLGLTYLRRIASALTWSPFGLAWAVPGDVASGRATEAWLSALAAALLVGLLWLAWLGLVHRGTNRRVRVAAEHSKVRLGAFDELPDTQTGVVAARSITYWLRDSRYVVPLLILPIIPIGLVVALGLGGIPWEIIVWLPVPLLSLFIGWSIHNDVASDGTAFWLHVVTSVRGRADRWGRVLVPLVVGLIVAIGGGIGSAALLGDQTIALPLVSLSVCALLGALGVSSVASALAPYPTVQPGDGPFQMPQGAGGDAGLKQAVSLLLAIAICLPVVGLIVATAVAGSTDYSAPTILGFILGPVALVAGIELGAFAMRQRAPELLAFTQQN